MAPQINEATIRLLTRHGCEVVIAEARAVAARWTIISARTDARLRARNIDAWSREIEAGGLDAIVINASGCGTTVKDYGFMFRDDPALAEKAAQVSALARDITEVMAEIGLQPPATPSGLRVAYHTACSLQHGQKITRRAEAPAEGRRLRRARPPEGHICCGSAGTYNLLQPEIAGAAARPQGGQYRKHRARRDRRRQYRLHHPDRRRDGDAGRAHGRTARLGDRRAAALRVAGMTRRHD